MSMLDPTPAEAAYEARINACAQRMALAVGDEREVRVIACALMAVVATLPVDLASQVAGAIAVQTNERDE